jgi:PTS system cellobiose-specific IIA component
MDSVMENNIFMIISCAGQARSFCFEALRNARKGNFDKAEECIEKAQAELLKTHNTHADMIHKEAAGEKMEVSLLLVHAEDHLMTAMFAKDLIQELVSFMKESRRTTGEVQ